MSKKKVIFITDGDVKAQKVIEEAARRIGGRCISSSGGNPSELDPDELLKLIHAAEGEPVLVMVDDAGTRRKGPGEAILERLGRDPSLEILGVLAVASETAKVEGVPVVASISRSGEMVNVPVDKEGNPEPEGHVSVEGDTVDVLNRLNIPVIIGIGDIGKQNRADRNARITTRAIREVLRRSEPGHSSEPN